MKIIFGIALLASACLASGASAKTSSYQLIYTAPAGTSFHPAIGAIQGSTLWGTDPTGGPAGYGIVFTISTSGANFTPVYQFTGTGPDGSTPNARLLILPNKEVLGTTLNGTPLNAGAVFELSATGRTLMWYHDFMASADGVSPQDGLAEGPEGYSYGTTSMAANQPGNGALFRVGPANHYQVVYKFQSEQDGHCPYTGVAIKGQAIYGTTVGDGYGGQPNGSVWHMLTGSPPPKTIYSFQNGTDGEWPNITPTLDGKGNLWGVTNTNVGPAAGALWSITSHGFEVEHSFTGGNDGSSPNGPLLLGHDGSLYGTTGGGANGYGTLFKFVPSKDTFETLYVFSADDGGATGHLVEDGRGRIYGGTKGGSIFVFTP